MENQEEAIRLEVKTNRQSVMEEALWCGVTPGMTILDAGCGPGKTSSILSDMVQPGGSIIGIDYSEERIHYARDHYGSTGDLTFYVRDLRDSLTDLGMFDLIWVRFVLEYNRIESFDIVKNLTKCLKPDGMLCLLDLDYNCLSHYEMPPHCEALVKQIMTRMDDECNFETYAGRKLYSYLYDLGYRHISVRMKAHHLIYGAIHDGDVFNWIKKI
jgi:2-polyprenyl-3-methyl-5-hydroxy-6-metoxy-1,4-benzoquinol methylase